MVKCWTGMALCMSLLLAQGVKAAETNLEANVEARTLYFTCVIDSKAPYFEYIEYAYTQVLKPLGYQFRLVSGGPEEVLRWLSDGQADGDCGHIPGYAERQGLADYLELDISMSALSFGAWSNLPIPAELKAGEPIDAHLRVGYIQGIEGSEDIIRGSQITNTRLFDSTDDGKLALHQGEIDIWIGRVLGVSQFTFRDKPKHVTILKTYPVIPLLHRRLEKNADTLAKKLGKAFSTLTFPEYIKQRNLRAASLPAGDTIHFNCALNNKSPLFHKMVSVYRQAFKELGKEFYMTTTLPGREMANLTSGLIDGSCGRTDMIFEKFGRDSLVLVNVPVMNVEFQMWTHLADLDASKLSDLNDGKLRVGYRYGLVVVDRDFQTWPVDKVHRLIHSEQGVKMLAAKRIDVYIDASERLHQAFKAVEYKADLRLLDVSIEATIYPILNVKHREIVDVLETVLKKQKPSDKDYLIY
jgi:ABC-type amino acid transport substrate-binding protein